MIVNFIDTHKTEYGVEPIIEVLRRAGIGCSVSGYYAAKKRPPSRRTIRDVELTERIVRTHRDNYGVYGARKVHATLQREGVPVVSVHRRKVDARRRSAQDLPSTGASHHPAGTAAAPSRRPGGPSLPCRSTEQVVGRRHYVLPNVLRIRLCGVRARCVRPEGRRLARVDPLRTDLALDALEIGICARTRDDQDLSALVHH